MWKLTHYLCQSWIKIRGYCLVPYHGSRLVIYYSQSITITITFENIQSITITITLKKIKSITITITLASITFHYILLQFGANLRGNFNTEIKLTGYFIHLILLKMLQIMPYKDKISQIYHLVYLQLNK